MDNQNEVWLELIRTIVPSIAAIGALLMAWRGAQAANAVHAQGKELLAVAEGTRTLVNGPFRAALAVNVETSLLLYEKSGLLIDKERWELATKTLRDHEEKEAEVEAKEAEHKREN